MAFPGSIVSFLGFTSTHTLSQDQHASQHNSEQSEIVAIETKLGTGSSTPSNNTVLRGNGAGTTTYDQVHAATDISGVLGTGNGGSGSTTLTFPAGTDTLVGRNTTDTLTNKTLTTPTIGDFTNANHNHQNTAGGGQLSGKNAIQSSTIPMSNIDWSTFSISIKSARGSVGSITPTNSVDNNFSSLCSISFTVSGAAYALVTVTTSVTSTSDFEHQPEIFLDGSLALNFQPPAQAGNASGRAATRSFTGAITLTNGSHTLSPGAFISSASSPSQNGVGLYISAIVFGNVTA